MNDSNNALHLKFIEVFLRDGADSSEYKIIKDQLYRQGYTRSQVVTLLVEGYLYGTLDNFYHRHPVLS